MLTLAEPAIYRLHPEWAYRTDFAILRAWCAERQVQAPGRLRATVAAFLAWGPDAPGPSTIGRRVAAIRYAHRLEGLPVPTDDERVRATALSGQINRAWRLESP